MTDVKLSLLNKNNLITFNSVQKISSGLFKNVINKMFTNHIFNIYLIYTEDLALNNPQCIHLLLFLIYI